VGVGGTGVREASFEARGGEILGIAAVEGNGERELLRAIAGLVKSASGRLRVTGPVSFIPEDRTTEALIGEFTLTENLVLSQGGTAPWVKRGWLDWPRAARRCGELIEQFGVRADGAQAVARTLSGGNQQRMVIAGALERKPAVLIAENITRGLDFRATAVMHAKLREASAAGVCVILHLADLDELLEVADRILVMANGVLSEPSREASRSGIGRRMLGMPD
jgi:simple sugar transport system ATP-binding protein